MQWFHRVWKDAVFSKLIAEGINKWVIGPLLALLLFLFPNVRALAKNAVTESLSWLAGSAAVPRWSAIMALSVICLGFAKAIFLRWKKSKQKRVAEDDPWSDYDTDIFFGYRWRWGFDQYRDVFGIEMFCPVCDHELMVKAKLTTFHDIRSKCDRCAYIASNDLPAVGFDAVRSAVAIEAKRQARGEGWKKAGARQAAFDSGHRREIEEWRN